MTKALDKGIEIREVYLLEKTGGDSMPEVADNLRRYQERIARTPAAPVPGDGSGGHGAA